ncbi:OB-fold nucleic acid binding domain-containing protein [Candidatus Bathyarchaeota archaeon]|nr:OB-fold nucleic acid binding domain-containing protein [Candidatus Bathyarchaeota archaeon]
MSRERGRPRGRYHNLVDFKALENLALISMKYGIDSNDFFNSFIEAWERQESTCESLSINCRKKTQDNAVFLITKGVKVVAQFSLSKSVLQKINPLKEFVDMTPLRKIHAEEKIVNPQIKDLKLGMNRINLKARVIEIPKPKSIFTRIGNFAKVTNAKVTDETGIIQLPLWNQQIDTVAVGDTIQVENARVVTFKGELQLKVGIGGQLSVIEKDAHVKRAEPEERD